MHTTSFHHAPADEESERKFRAIFEHAQDGICLMQDGRFTDANPCALALFGRSRETFLGHSPLEFSPVAQPGGEASAELAQRHIAGALRGEPQRFEWTHLRPDGAPFVVEVSLGRLDLREGPQLFAIVRDLTNHKRAEAHRAQLEAIGTLAGGMAHDFNNILGAIVTYTELARQDAQGNPELLDNLAQVRKASDRAASLVRQILALSPEVGEANELPPATLLAGAAEGASPGRGEHILLVEDEVALCQSTRRFLQSLGYRVSAVTDPVAALAAFRAVPGDFQLVITDLTMPQMSGADLAKEILRARRLPVLLATGFSATWTDGEARRQGLRGLLQKPFLPDELSAIVLRTLAEHSQST